jgi:hypothetical protein
MDINIFKEDFSQKLDFNFSNNSKYFEFNSTIFSDLKTQVFEINKCIILELYHTSITSTNNLLERLLKLSLIYNETGISPIEPEKLDDVFSPPNKKYSSMVMKDTIKLCLEYNLIIENEFKFLDERVRDFFRNGFSHADTSKTMKNVPDKTQMFVGNFSNPNVMKPIDLNTKSIPMFQSIILNEISKKNAQLYFHNVYALILNIDNRLKQKFK